MTPSQGDRTLFISSAPPRWDLSNGYQLIVIEILWRIDQTLFIAMVFI